MSDYDTEPTFAKRYIGGSEEIASADSLLTANAELRGALDVALEQIDAEHDLTKALLIRMRKYIMRHGLLMGECVAWMQLKTRYGIGQSEEADAIWLREHETDVDLGALPLVPPKEAS